MDRLRDGELGGAGRAAVPAVRRALSEGSVEWTAWHGGKVSDLLGGVNGNCNCGVGVHVNCNYNGGVWGWGSQGTGHGVIQRASPASRNLATPTPYPAVAF